ncbi:DUF6233 domain-containing protein [Streptomyces sp. NPDC060205]|uniref:DUF6233 domain-containing protein n=1 Tax=Streptomyces sp. NPDC060205 TaxID=3347072 RepID=UPI0036618D0E
MFDYLPADLARLLTLRTWHAMWLHRIDAKTAAVRHDEAEQKSGLLAHVPGRECVVELGIRAGRPPVEVHAGHHFALGRRHKPLSRDDARRLLDAGLRACGHRTQDTALDILLSSRPALPPAAR